MKRRRSLTFVIALALALVMVGVGAVLAVEEGPATECYTDEFDNVNQEGGDGYTSRDYDIGGLTVTVHFSWTADKHLTVWVTGGTASNLYIKTGGGNNDPDSGALYGPYNGVGPWNVYHPNEPGTAGLALSHMNFCLTPEEPPTGCIKVIKSWTDWGDASKEGYGADAVMTPHDNDGGSAPFVYSAGQWVALICELSLGDYAVSEWDADGYIKDLGVVTISEDGQVVTVNAENVGTTTTTSECSTTTTSEQSTTTTSEQSTTTTSEQSTTTTSEQSTTTTSLTTTTTGKTWTSGPDGQDQNWSLIGWILIGLGIPAILGLGGVGIRSLIAHRD